jgi:selenophosphate synthetase-related protein
METLKEIVKIIKEFKGFSRKAEIGDIIKIIGNIEYDDAGIIEFKENYIVISADGITEDLVKLDPWLAGYYSVLVNVNDVVVKGAKPIGYVNVISGPKEIRNKIAQGVHDGLKKYGIKLLKGHTHPDTSYSAIDAAVIGIAKKVIRGTTAKPNHKILIAIDINGFLLEKSWTNCFDSTINKSSEDIKNMISSLINFIELNNNITCSKDISAPGIIGSLAMLCEASNVGAKIYLDKIPRPKNISIYEWLITYPAMGFIFGINDFCETKILENVGFSVEYIGEFISDNKIILILNNKEEIFMDLSKESVIGIKK